MRLSKNPSVELKMGAKRLSSRNIEYSCLFIISQIHVF